MDGATIFMGISSVWHSFSSTLGFRMAQQHPDTQLGIDAARTLLARGQRELLGRGLLSKREVEATALARALANASDARATAVLGPLVDDARRPLSVRREAVRGVVRGSKGGAGGVLARVRQKKLPVDLRQAEVEDDGVGFDVDAVLAGPVVGRFGLLSMDERVRPFGGRVNVESGEEAGTTVFIQVPLAGANGSPDE